MTTKKLRKRLRSSFEGINWINVVIGVVIGCAFIVIVLFVAIFIKGWSSSSTNESMLVAPSASPSSTPDSSHDPDADNQDQTKGPDADDLTVDPDDYAWSYPDRYAELVKSYGFQTEQVNGDEFPVFVIGSIQPGRLWTDAIGPALPEQTLDAVIARTLAEPDYGYQVCNGLYNTVLPTPYGEVALLDPNSWLEECADITQTNDWAVNAMNGTPAQRLQSAKELALVAMLLERLTVIGIGDGTTDFNYHLVVNGDGSILAVNEHNPSGTIPEFELNPLQYEGQFILLGVAIKGHPIGCTFIGFNVGWNGLAGDGRFALINNCELPPPVVECTSDCTPLPPCPPGGCPVPKPNTPAGYDYPTDTPQAPVTEVKKDPPVVYTVPPDDPPVVTQPNEGGDGDGTVTD